MLEINYDEVVKSGATEEMYVPDENIELTRVTFRRENIHSILKGKVHEKIDDSRLYLWFAAVTLGLALVCAGSPVIPFITSSPRSAPSSRRGRCRDGVPGGLSHASRPADLRAYENFDVAAQPVKFILRISTAGLRRARRS